MSIKNKTNKVRNIFLKILIIIIIVVLGIYLVLFIFGLKQSLAKKELFWLRNISDKDLMIRISSLKAIDLNFVVEVKHDNSFFWKRVFFSEDYHPRDQNLNAIVQYDEKNGQITLLVKGERIFSENITELEKKFKGNK